MNRTKTFNVRYTVVRSSAPVAFFQICARLLGLHCTRLIVKGACRVPTPLQHRFTEQGDTVAAFSVGQDGVLDTVLQCGGKLEIFIADEEKREGVSLRIEEAWEKPWRYGKFLVREIPIAYFVVMSALSGAPGILFLLGVLTCRCYRWVVYAQYMPERGKLVMFYSATRTGRFLVLCS